jgi:hypothetical protein
MENDEKRIDENVLKWRLNDGRIDKEKTQTEKDKQSIEKKSC